MNDRELLLNLGAAAAITVAGAIATAILLERGLKRVGQHVFGWSN
jgi:hypothetical protein